jgi:hypothetical protein
MSSGQWQGFVHWGGGDEGSGGNNSKEKNGSFVNMCES